MKNRSLTVETVRRIWDYDSKRERMVWKIANNIELGSVAGTMVDGRYWLTYEKQRYHMAEIVWLLNTGSLPDSPVREIDGNAMNWAMANLVTENQILKEREKPSPRPFAWIMVGRPMKTRLSDSDVQWIRESYELSDKSPSGIRWRRLPRHHFGSDNEWKARVNRLAGKPAGKLEVCDKTGNSAWKIAFRNRRIHLDYILPILQHAAK